MAFSQADGQREEIAPGFLPPAIYLHPWRAAPGIHASRDVPTSL